MGRQDRPPVADFQRQEEGHSALCPYTAWSGCSKLPRGDTRTERLLRRPPKAYDLAMTQGGHLDSRSLLRVRDKHEGRPAGRPYAEGRDSSPKLRMTRESVSDTI